MSPDRTPACCRAPVTSQRLTAASRCRLLEAEGRATPAVQPAFVVASRPGEPGPTPTALLAKAWNR